MSNEVTLVSDGDGLAIIGEDAAVERFIKRVGLDITGRPLPQLSRVLRAGSATARGLSLGAENSGRWLKMTKESFDLVNAHGYMESTSSGLRMGVVQAKGQAQGIKGILQFENSATAALNPAMLAGVGGVMAQLAMQQAMEEITQYLATIDQKVDDILRAQKDAVLADMIGVGFALDEAMTLRHQVGRVSDVTWSKVQTTAMTVARTQAYALRQLDAIAEKLENRSRVPDRAKSAVDAEAKVVEWLAVIARSVQLLDAFSVLELDRVLDAAPDELDKHRIALKESRTKRLGLIAQSIDTLVARLDAAAHHANDNVLLHPIAARSIVAASNNIASDVVEFQRRLDVELSRDPLEAKRWAQAALEARDTAVEAVAEGTEVALRTTSAAVNRARGATKQATENVVDGVSDFIRRRRKGDSE